MDENLVDVKIDVSISIPIIGDKSISLLNPPDGFEYKIIKLDEYEYKNKIIDGNGDILFDFTDAIHVDNGEEYILVLSYNKIIACKSEVHVNSVGALNNGMPIFEKIKDDFDELLFKYFSLIHIYKEGDVTQKVSFYKFTVQEGMCKNCLSSSTQSADSNTLNLHPLIVKEEDVSEINKYLSCDDRIYKILRNAVLSDLLYSYHIFDFTTNYKNLCSTLEVMFIKREEKSNKKKMLSSRIAVFLEEDDVLIKNLYKKVKVLYGIRGEAVHAGKSVEESKLLELRDLLRKCIKKYIQLINEKFVNRNNVNFGDVRGEIIRIAEKKIADKKKLKLFG